MPDWRSHWLPGLTVKAGQGWSTLVTAAAPSAPPSSAAAAVGSCARQHSTADEQDAGERLW